MNTMRVLMIFLLSAVAAACSAAPKELHEGMTYQIDDAMVLSVSVPMFGSGFLEAWAIVEISTSDNESLETYVLYAGEDSDGTDVEFPEVGSICSLTANAEFIYGHNSRSDPIHEFLKLVSTLMTCDDREYDFHF